MYRLLPAASLNISSVSFRGVLRGLLVVGHNECPAICRDSEEPPYPIKATWLDGGKLNAWDLRWMMRRSRHPRWGDIPF